MTALPPFQTLLDEHAAEVMAVLRGAVGRSDAEDCFQETFLAALRAYPQLRDARNLRGWLLTIAHRKAIDHHRASGRQPLPVGDVASTESGEAGLLRGAPTRARIPAGKAGTGGRARRSTEGAVRAGGELPVEAESTAGQGSVAEDGIWELVGALPPKQRAAIALRYACDLPHAEIAAALGCSPEAARRSLHEGMKRLRSELAGVTTAGEEGVDAGL